MHWELCQRPQAPTASSHSLHCQALLPEIRLGPAHLQETPSQAPNSQGHACKLLHRSLSAQKVLTDGETEAGTRKQLAQGQTASWWQSWKNLGS